MGRFLLLAMLASVALWAEGRCPPGFFPTGGGNAGWLGCAPMGPGAGEAEGGGGGRGLPRMQYSPEQWADWIEASKRADAEREAERMKDPVYRKLKEGYWEFPDSSQSPGSANVCVASFLTARGGVVILDWTGERGGTAIAYYGGGIPTTRVMKRMKVSLTQSGATQTVQAFHGPFPWANQIGMVMFAVPSTEALLKAMEDKQDFEVTVAGGSWISGAWHSGLAARDKLRQCVQDRKQK